MIQSAEVKSLVRAAEQHYSYELPYHNWDHAQTVMEEVEKVAERAEMRGVLLSRQALQVAAAWHDAGYHEDHTLHNASIKEDYSIQLFNDHLASEQYDLSPNDAMTVKAAIRGTIHQWPYRKKHGLALHLADVANLGGPYEAFVANTKLLYQEATLLNNTPLTWSQYAHGVPSFARSIAHEMTRELPKLREEVGTADSFDTRAYANAFTLSQTLQ